MALKIMQFPNTSAIILRFGAGARIKVARIKAGPGKGDILTAPVFVSPDFTKWVEVALGISVRVDESSALVCSTDGGKTSTPSMKGWRIPLARSVLKTSWGVVASGPGGAYLTNDGETWTEMKLWPESVTGAADFLHAYWMGRYYGFVQ